jgi:hypothetical protein
MSLKPLSCDELVHIQMMFAASSHEAELSQLEKFVQQKLFKKDPALLDSTEKLIEKFHKIKLEGAHAERFKNAYELYLKYSGRKQNFEKKKENEAIAIKDELWIAKIPSNSTSGLEKLLHIAKKWQKCAKDRYEKAVKEGVDRPLIDKIADSRCTLKYMLVDLEDKATRRNLSYYIAFNPANFSVQAIGQLGLGEKNKCITLYFLATNPKNIPLFKEDQANRGGGSAVLAGITREIQNSKKYKNLPFHLVSLPTAAEFYRKRGFKKIPEKKEENTKNPPQNTTPYNSPVAQAQHKKEATHSCGYETDTEEEKKSLPSDESWHCICTKIHDPIRERADANIEFSFPKAAQKLLLERTKNVPQCKKISWHKLRSGV